MDFPTATKTCFSKYMDSSGRAPRSEYWYYVLFLIIGGAVTAMLDHTFLPNSSLSPLNSIFSLVTLLPSIAVTARRLHDVDRSGWWQLIWLIPLVGWIVMLIWTTKRGTPGPNRFGPDPLPAAGASPMPA